MKTILNIFLIALVVLLFPACEIIGDIFKAGMYWGIFLVVALVALILYIVAKIRR